MEHQVKQPHQSNYRWKDVPEEHWRNWQSIFQSSREILKLSAACPVCGKTALYRYYALYTPRESVIDGIRFVGRGGLWEWCRACYSYCHYSAGVPEWWECDLGVAYEELTHDPTPIEEEIRNREQNVVGDESA
jgi:hypothetical protein